jgi:23S rRNA-/tRNA-specific pseudouridylate synthase
MNAGLIRINGTKKSLDTTLLNGDNISRIVHWHEPPIMTPAKISLTKHPVRQMFEDSSSSAESIIYCINKPSTIPVYPAGPFYANSLLSMVEAQEGLPPKSLHPCHRLDRCTSGVLLCTNTSEAASLVQRHLQCKNTRKLYVARVKGKFPTSSDILNNVPDFVSLRCDDGTIEVSAPISTQLDSSSSDEMLKRFVCRDGKPSVSRFRLLHYDPKGDLSTVLCRPLSGRGHQLRVHLALLGNSIHNDIEYGGSLCDERKKEHMALSMDALLEASAKNAPCLREESVSSEEADAAIKLCSCCSGGVEGVKSSFKVCQLLGGLQAIDLHAAKYFIDTDSKSKATFVTDLPEWANAVSNEGLKFV